MDEPIHPSESEFWDQVADWLLEARNLGHGGLGPAQTAARLRDVGQEQGREPN